MENGKRQTERRKVKNVGLRVATLHIGTMIYKGRDWANMMQKREVSMLFARNFQVPDDHSPDT